MQTSPMFQANVVQHSRGRDCKGRIGSFLWPRSGSFSVGVRKHTCSRGELVICYMEVEVALKGLAGFRIIEQPFYTYQTLMKSS